MLGIKGFRNMSMLKVGAYSAGLFALSYLLLLLSVTFLDKDMLIFRHAYDMTTAYPDNSTKPEVLVNINTMEDNLITNIITEEKNGHNIFKIAGFAQVIEEVLHIPSNMSVVTSYGENNQIMAVYNDNK